MLKKTLILILAALLAIAPAFATRNLELDLEPHEGVDVELVMFLFDKCGGCGADSPGCGNCKEMVRFHGIIKERLGDRLYDGTIYYAMHNCRIEYNDMMYEAYFDIYDIPDELYGYRPATFIGTPEGGLYLLGEQMLPYVDTYVDKYLEGGDLAEIQAEIDALRLEVIDEYYSELENAD